MYLHGSERFSTKMSLKGKKAMVQVSVEWLPDHLHNLHIRYNITFLTLREKVHVDN